MPSARLLPYAAAMRALQVFGVITIIIAGLAFIAAATGGAGIFWAVGITFGLIGAYLLMMFRQAQKRHTGA
jgi:hypothetical protein